MPLGYSALSLLAFVGEIVFSNLVFKCPCNSWNHAYGLVSLLVPASLLFLLGFLVNNSLWKQVTGFCNANAFNKGCGSRCSKRLFCLRKFFQVTFWSFFSPLTWCALALLRADIYECIQYGIPSDFMKDIYCGKNDECKKELLLIPCVYSPNLNVSKDVLEEIKGYIRAESQVYGWILLASVLLLTVFASCCMRCFSPFHHLQLRFQKMCKENERKFFDQESEQHAKKLAERNVKGFFNQVMQKKLLIPEKKDWSIISTGDKSDNNKTYYTPLHKFIETKFDGLETSTSTLFIEESL